MCNCKHGKGQKLNNLDSLDHLKLASDVYVNVIEHKSVEEFDEFDNHEVLSVYSQLFPNQRMKATVEQAIGQIKLAHERYTQQKR